MGTNDASQTQITNPAQDQDTLAMTKIHIIALFSKQSIA